MQFSISDGSVDGLIPPVILAAACGGLSRFRSRDHTSFGVLNLTPDVATEIGARPSRVPYVFDKSIIS